MPTAKGRGGVGPEAFTRAKMIRGSARLRTDCPPVISRGSPIAMVEALFGAASAVALVLHASR
jgi:hypothetical protein